MRIASLVVGIIGGCIGILCSIILLIQAMISPVTAFDGKFVITVAVVALVMNILALTFACMSNWKHKITGSILLFATVVDTISVGACIEVDNPILFVCFIAVAIMSLVASILRLLQNKQQKETKVLV